MENEISLEELFADTAEQETAKSENAEAFNFEETQSEENGSFNPFDEQTSEQSESKGSQNSSQKDSGFSGYGAEKISAIIVMAIDGSLQRWAAIKGYPVSVMALKPKESKELLSALTEVVAKYFKLDGLSPEMKLAAIVFFMFISRYFMIKKMTKEAKKEETQDAEFSEAGNDANGENEQKPKPKRKGRPKLSEMTAAERTAYEIRKRERKHAKKAVGLVDNNEVEKLAKIIASQ